MILLTDGSIPSEFYQFAPDPPQGLNEAFSFYHTLSEIEIAYSYTVLDISAQQPTADFLKRPGTLYSYCPDQRPITLRLIGKPSPGLSPPVDIKFTIPGYALYIERTTTSEINLTLKKTDHETKSADAPKE